MDPRYCIVADLQEHTLYRFEIVASTRVESGPYAYKITRTDISGIYVSRFLHSIVGLKANVSKTAVMVFSRNPIEGELKWDEHALPRASDYTYLE